jgi:hypothetical protein
MRSLRRVVRRFGGGGYRVRRRHSSNAVRHRIVPTLMERVAAQQPAQRQPAAVERTEPRDRLDRVLTARGQVTARREQPWADGQPVEPDRDEQDPSRHRRAFLRRRDRPGHGTPKAVSAESSSPPSSPEAAEAALGRARATTHVPSGNRESRSAIWARSRRATRWRITLPPTPRPTTMPTRAVPSRSVLTWRTTSRRATLRPRRTTARNSAEDRIRCAAGSMSAADVAAQADSSRRPLRRRAERMLRPARVRMRSRKPCVFARRRLFGW